MLKRKVKISLSAAQIHSSDPNCKHKILVCRSIENGIGGIVIIVNTNLGRDEIGPESVHGHIGENADKKSNQKHRDDSSRKCAIRLSLFISMKCGVIKEIPL